MSRNQLESDLMRNASDRLSTWRRDTVMRCEIGNLSTEAKISIVFTALVGEIVQIARCLKMSDSDFATLMQEALRDWKQRVKDFERKENESNQT